MDVYIYEGNKKDETDILLSMIVSKKYHILRNTFINLSNNCNILIYFFITYKIKK